MSEKTEFLYQAISDAQSTIRSIDVKCGFMFVLLFFPTLYIDKADDVVSLVNKAPSLIYWISMIDLASWFSSIIALFMAVAAISNPESRINGINGTRNKRGYYSGDLFQLKFFDVFVNTSRVAKRSLAEEAKLIPNNEQQIIDELVFERMKLCYIRDVKILRLNFCLASGIFSIIVSFFILIYFFE